MVGVLRAVGIDNDLALEAYRHSEGTPQEHQITEDDILTALKK